MQRPTCLNLVSFRSTLANICLALHKLQKVLLDGVFSFRYYSAEKEREETLGMEKPQNL